MGNDQKKVARRSTRNVVSLQGCWAHSARQNEEFKDPEGPQNVVAAPLYCQGSAEVVWVSYRDASLMAPK